ncbi:hypothetical protein [Cohnella nanjingensis]|uniref:Lipoprotein n=1 Tax=Cohnella nanjingensis TaxID=1387779 RepID=A0A7X0RWH0_9BACL|nr:hypothetical protein [Cohnella nanjingensis]MBB6674937.1 hypothetical protein [Cohnella nanjingensis]
MKRLLFLATLTLFAVAVGGCRFGPSESGEAPVEMIAFAGLAEDELSRIPTSPKDSDVRKVTVRDEIAPLLDKRYDGKEVYAVTFRHTETEATGPITVYVDLDRQTVVGKGAPPKGASAP